MVMFFEDLSRDGYNSHTGVRPIWTVDLANEDELLRYLNNDFDERTNRYVEVAAQYRENLALYKGIHYRSTRIRRTYDEEIDFSKNPRMVFNHIYDLVESRVASVCKFKPNFIVEPANPDEMKDKNDAKMMKTLIDGLFSQEKVAEIERECQRMADIYGESYCFVDWDKDKGIEHPLSSIVPPIEYSVTLDDGTSVTVKKKLRIGDVCYRIMTPDRVMLSNHKNFDEVDSVCLIDYEDVSTVRARYPELASDIKANAYHIMDVNLEDSSIKDTDTLVRHHFYKSGEFLDRGLHIISTPEKVLEIKYMDFDGWNFVRWTDIDISGELHAISFIRLIKQAQRFFNNIMNWKAKATSMAALPKWVYPKGTVQVEQLENSVAMSYKGPTPPQLVSYQQGSDQSYQLADRIEKFMEKISGVYSTSRGAPPPGVTAAVALQFMDEQESSRNANRFNKRKDCIIALADLTGRFIAKYYTEEHLKAALGLYQSQFISDFKSSNFDSRFCVKYSAMSALPESKALRNQTLIDLKQQFPNAIKDDQVLDLLEFSNDEKFRDIASVSIKSAEAENDLVMQETMPEDAKEWEDHIVHYRTHLMFMQEQFFIKLTPQQQQAMKDHVIGHEFLMYEKSKTNPAFKALLAQFPLFPIFYKDLSTDIQTQLNMAGGQSTMPQPQQIGVNNGNAITEQQ